MKRTRRIISLALSLSLIFSFAFHLGSKAENVTASPLNNYPIVLVHGLFGWGNTEIAHLNYWGGTDSIRELLQSKGYTVYTPTIGPVSSNWDRACELYAYLVGGTVDYGAAHSKKYGHERYGRKFGGVLPELNEPDSILKIHLVGHSMGGETIRMLAQLLENGDTQEQAETTDGSLSPLFSGKCRHWIDSITTIATPHDGSQFDDTEYKLEPLMHQFVAALAAAAGTNIDDTNLGLDFRLDQWGLEREAGESYVSYYKRVMSSNLWKKTNDLSIYDLDTDGAAVLNAYAKAQPDIYYFTISCSDTYASPVYPHYQIPYPNMNLALLKSSIYMGHHVNYAVGHVTVDEAWWENDGIVSVRSATRPHSDSSDPYNENYGVAQDGTYQFKSNTPKGTWNYIEEIENTDHINVVGQSSNKAYLQSKFIQLAAMLESIS
ncbi:Lipase [Caprobacter fermentans]|uniref:triacylglycerol lipase n=1 Tax=Caproicibacter fermentans TaxID=2576756 RepID=A0A6N8HV50_9FIRM|nr:lipase [Caproicibacter fermentans]MVB09410.1 Lipase [Caproicibacter fermentans]OCN02936.1 lipase [Clostridium sp. W14A]QNK41517.1 lipase [Caproicibacter fermentans]